MFIKIRKMNLLVNLNAFYIQVTDSTFPKYCFFRRDGCLQKTRICPIKAWTGSWMVSSILSDVYASIHWPFSLWHAEPTALREGWILMSHWNLSPPAPSKRLGYMQTELTREYMKQQDKTDASTVLIFFHFTLKFGWVNVGKTNSFLSVWFPLLEIPDWKKKSCLMCT